MTDPNRDTTYAAGAFAEAVAAADTGDNRLYLGDLAATERIVRGFIYDITSTFQSLGEVKAEADRLARAFLGGDPENYAPVPGWNAPDGRLAPWIAEYTGIAEKDSGAILRTAFGLIARETIQGVRSAAEGAHDTQWQAQLDDLIRYWTRVLAGVPAA